MGEREFGEPTVLPKMEVHKTTKLDSGEPIPEVFRPKPILAKRYIPIEGKRYRIPRKAKKYLKRKMCELHNMELRKLKFSYKRINAMLKWRKKQ